MANNIALYPQITSTDPTYQEFKFQTHIFNIFCQRWKSTPAANLSKTLLTVKLELLEKNWKNLMTSFNQLFSSILVSDSSRKFAPTYNSCSEQYFSIKAEIVDALSSTPEFPKTSKTLSNNPNPTKTSAQSEDHSLIQSTTPVSAPKDTTQKSPTQSSTPKNKDSMESPNDSLECTQFQQTATLNLPQNLPEVVTSGPAGALPPMKRQNNCLFDTKMYSPLNTMLSEGTTSTLNSEDVGTHSNTGKTSYATTRSRRSPLPTLPTELPNPNSAFTNHLHCHQHLSAVFSPSPEFHKPYKDDTRGSTYASPPKLETSVSQPSTANQKTTSMLSSAVDTPITSSSLYADIGNHCKKEKDLPITSCWSTSFIPHRKRSQQQPWSPLHYTVLTPRIKKRGKSVFLPPVKPQSKQRNPGQQHSQGKLSPTSLFRTSFSLVSDQLHHAYPIQKVHTLVKADALHPALMPHKPKTQRTLPENRLYKDTSCKIFTSRWLFANMYRKYIRFRMQNQLYFSQSLYPSITPRQKFSYHAFHPTFKQQKRKKQTSVPASNQNPLTWSWLTYTFYWKHIRLKKEKKKKKVFHLNRPLTLFISHKPPSNNSIRITNDVFRPFSPTGTRWSQANVDSAAGSTHYDSAMPLKL